MFDAFLDNHRAKETLTAYLGGGRFPHAVLLEGPKGTGRRTFAAYMAAALCCREEHRPCLHCNACRKVLQGMHPDVSVYGGGSGSRSFHIDVIREIRAGAYVRPNEADVRVYILCDVQDMTVQAQNALLKILEEPPAHTVFLLTCENRWALLPTMLSRLQILPIEPLSPERCVQALQALRPQLPKERLLSAAEAARGSVGQALALLDDPERAALLKAVGEILALVTRGSEYALLAAMAPYSRKREGFTALMEMLHGELSHQLIAYSRGDAGDFQLTPLQLQKMLGIIENSRSLAEQNGNVPLLATVFVSRMKSALI